LIIDFHSHFLPCIDDGSKSTEMSLEMLKKMKGQNVDTVVATVIFMLMKIELMSSLVIGKMLIIA